MTGRVFDDAARARYLAHVAAGHTLAQAATATPIHPNVPARHARTDPAFGQALADARAVGKKARREGVPHGEYRYNCLQCRCGVCRAAARKGRAGRRAVEADADGADGGAVVPPGQVRELRAGPEFPSSPIAA
ncbi:hypothetical protein E6R18_24895 [Streptomyces sp. A1277]|uniref:hypothetical protein n=1 Tax=Streptomyces sp. A1277 TaxID=2563103 RepID=UPI0010A2223A|nr:hypothetical protein [Streptomyces sp. A1277]THA29152.1 hypothetical protein E6R18_24895 [Streptomyces sp. A1277]